MNEIINRDEKKQNQPDREEIVQALFTCFTIFVIFIILGIIFFINPECKIERNAYACPPPTPTPLSFTSLGAALTDAQWNWFHPKWPNAERNEVRVLDDSDNRLMYKCAPWSVKRATNATWEPDLSTLQQYIDVMAGYDSCSESDSNCSLIIMDDPSTTGGWDHVMNIWEGYGPPWNKRAKYSDGEYVWESKLGKGIRIVHRRNALNGSDIYTKYGTATYFYKRQ